MLVNNGTRSGKEILAYGLKQNRNGDRDKTAGAVVGGRPFLLKMATSCILLLLMFCVENG